MAQRRMLSRRVSQSEKVNKLSVKAQIVWTWTLPWLDDNGCYTGNPDDIKSEVFPRNPKISKKDIEAALLEQAEVGTIVLYKTQDRVFQQYNNFEKTADGVVFQTFKNDREKESLYPQYQQGFEIIGNKRNPEDSAGNSPYIKLTSLNLNSLNLNSGGVGGKSFVPPTPQEVADYAKSIGFNLDALYFVDYYATRNWKVGKNKMKDWKAAIRTWRHNDNERNGNGQRAGNLQSRTGQQQTKPFSINGQNFREV